MSKHDIRTNSISINSEDLKVNTMFEIKSAERYVPYTKSREAGPFIRLSSSGYISVNEHVYSSWIKPAKKIDLQFVVLREKDTGKTRNAIGIKPITTEDGLTVGENSRSKSKYISARGFLSRYNISPEDNKVLDCFFDPDQKIIVAPLKNGASQPPATGGDYDRGELTAQNGDNIKDSILSLVPTRNSGKGPLSKPDLVRLMAEKEGFRSRARAKKRNFRARINHAVETLHEEGKLEVDKKLPWRQKSRTFTAYYYKVN